MRSPLSRWLLGCVGIGAVALLAVSCSASQAEPLSTKQLSEQTIETQLASELGLGGLEATCPEISLPAINSNFACMATTSDDAVINAEATVTPDGRIEIKTTNVIRSAALDGFERRAAADLNGATGAQLLDTDFNCGEQAVVLDSNKEMVCGVQANGDVYDVTFTVKDIEATRFDINVADSPRS